jgi:hypothetical protein
MSVGNYMSLFIEIVSSFSYIHPFLSILLKVDIREYYQEPG